MSELKKLYTSVVLGFVFLVVASSYAYSITGRLASGVFERSCQTGLGHLLHTLVFFFAVLVLMMVKGNLMNREKPVLLYIKYSIYSALVYYLLASKDMFAVVNSVIPGVSDETGCPTVMGVTLHAVVYGLALYLLMQLPKDLDEEY
jgi:hypothetical protein